MTKAYIKDYPRPQFVRDNWLNLNGSWDFWFDGENSKQTINVPFTYETSKSGIGSTDFHSVIWYEKEINVDKDRLQKDDCILHFEGSDYETLVWVNDQFIGTHKGAYERFSFNITSVLLKSEGNATIKVKVIDSNSAEQPRGKQRWIKNNFGCWYVQTTGIWKTVWLEYVPKVRIEHVKMTPDMTNACMHFVITTNIDEASIFSADTYVKTKVTYKGMLIGEKTSAITKRHIEECMDMYVRKSDCFEWGIASWTPEHPDLYDVELELIKDNSVIDHIDSYCAMREITIDGNMILLNGEPLYQRLILDQGYWEESGLTPPSEEALINDIEKTKALGFNGLRKHQKTEDERFLYWCDVKGLLVWSEMAAAYDFSDDAINMFTDEWMQIVKQNYNHPCIITWTPFNETWGLGGIKTLRGPQHFTEAIYNLTKSYDPMRPVIVNDGWEHTVSDIITLHDYEEKGEVFFERYTRYKDQILNGEKNHCWNKKALADGYSYKGQPVIISEYGGIAFKDSKQDAWGYGNMVETEEEFLKRLESITAAIKKLDYVCGFCYTQTSDVEQEINGLLDSNHEYKIAPEKLRNIFS